MFLPLAIGRILFFSIDFTPFYIIFTRFLSNFVLKKERKNAYCTTIKHYPLYYKRYFAVNEKFLNLKKKEKIQKIANILKKVISRENSCSRGIIKSNKDK